MLMFLSKMIHRRRLVTSFLCFLVVTTTVVTQTPASQEYFTDVVLINQHNKPMRLYSDLLMGKVVIINTFFSHCESVCPVINGNMAKIQKFLGDRLGRDVFIISISVDSVNDTPAQLKLYAKNLNARPGWFFLSGKKENVEIALNKLGLNAENREAHPNIVIIGNDSSGMWKKAFGLAPTNELFKIVESVINDNG